MHQYKNIKHRHTQNWGGERECKEINKTKTTNKKEKKITNNGKFSSAISSRTEK